MDIMILIAVFLLQFGLPLGAMALGERLQWSESVTALIAISSMVGAFCVVIYT